LVRPYWWAKFREQEHQHARQCCDAEAGNDRSQQGQRRHRKRENSRQRDIIGMWNQHSDGAGQGFAPDVLVTDKLRSYGAAKSEIGLSARQDQGLRANNRAENSHQPTRRRERTSNRPDQLNASCPFKPPSKTLSTASAISHPAARSASSERKPSGRGEPPPRPESELGLQIFARPNSVRVTRSS
jgi:hypothetical protein